MIEKLKNITDTDIPKINASLKSYFFIGTNGEQNVYRAFDTNSVAGQLVAFQLGKQLKPDFSEEVFIQQTLEKFENITSTKEAINVIREIYFHGNKLPIFSPLMYMSQPYKSLDAKTKKTLVIFLQMMQVSDNELVQQKDVNFLEKRILDFFSKYVIDKKHTTQSNSYVHYLDDTFTKDFTFLLSNPNYFKSQIDTFLKFYLFVYSAQLTLNVQTTPLEEPQLKPLYFILNHERASRERKNIVNHGYKTLIDKTRYLFPYLSLLEHLADIVEDPTLKLYHFSMLEDNQNNISIIDNVTKVFRQAKSLPTKIPINSPSISEAMRSLLSSAFEQFKGDKKAVIERFIAAYEQQVSKHFYQIRGQFGKVLVLDQDKILLLTNLAIGKNEKLRFQDLLLEFQKRSVYFDPMSEDVLLELYERVGNIERKSDSGDAVYVRAI